METWGTHNNLVRTMGAHPALALRRWIMRTRLSSKGDVRGNSGPSRREWHNSVSASGLRGSSHEGACHYFGESAEPQPVLDHTSWIYFLHDVE